MKLGIKIVFTSGGVQDGPMFNNDESLRKYASDVRPFLRKTFPTREELKAKGKEPFSSFDESSKIVCLLQFLGAKGYLFTLIKARPEQTGRTFDNTAAWIHVPLKADLSNTEFQQVLDEISSLISDPYNLNESKLQEVANREYEENTALIPPLTSRGENVAVFLYGHGSKYELTEILGGRIRQPGFADYRALFLVDTKQNIALHDGVLANVKVKNPILIENPKECDGFKPLLGSEPFNRPVEIIEGQSISITWKQNGYQDIVKNVKVLDGVDVNNYRPQPNEEYFIFYRNWFNVYSASNDPLQNVKVAINDKQFTGDTLLIRKDTLEHGYRLSVSCRGYEGYNENHIKNVYRKNIELKKITRRYEFSLTAYDDNGVRLKELVQAVLETTARITTSPIKGYDVDGKIYEGGGNAEANKLSYTDGTIMSKIKFFCLGAALVALIWGVVYFFNHYEFVWDWPPIQEKIEKTSNTTSDDSDDAQSAKEQSTEALAQVNKDSIKAIEYLDNPGNGIWKKQEMESIPYLKGLFDALNTFDFRSLSDKWNPKLNQSNRFHSIMKQVDINLQNKWKQVGNSQNNYNSDTDTRISVNNYVNWLKTEHQGFHSVAGTTAGGSLVSKSDSAQNGNAGRGAVNN